MAQRGESLLLESSKMRKGFSLVEVLAVMAVLSLVFATFTRFFRVLLSDLPRNSRLVQENCSLLNLVEHIRADVSCAKGLPQTSDGTLSVKLGEAVVVYEPAGQADYRRRFTKTGGPSEDTVWSIPHGRIGWNLRHKNGGGYAVEVKTHLEYNEYGHLQKKMANSYLFFVGTAGRTGQ